MIFNFWGKTCQKETFYAPYLSLSQGMAGEEPDALF